MTTLDLIEKTLNPANRPGSHPDYLEVAPHIICADGFSMSVQASRFAYCSPRNNVGPWIQVEVGFPSQKSDALMPYAEDSSSPTQTVYGYVPIEIVAQVIDEHGGAR